MNNYIAARMELNELIDQWSIRNDLSPADEISLVEKELALLKEAARRISLEEK